VPESPKKGWRRPRATNVAAKDRGRLTGRPDEQSSHRRPIPVDDRPRLPRQQRKEISAAVRARHQLEVVKQGKLRVKAWCTCGRWEAVDPAGRGWGTARRSFNGHVARAMNRALRRAERQNDLTS
jgi:hypothetical protein